MFRLVPAHPGSPRQKAVKLLCVCAHLQLIEYKTHFCQEAAGREACGYLLQISNDPVFAPGVLGPYYSVMVPEFWTNEGGQSLTGKLVSVFDKQKL